MSETVWVGLEEFVEGIDFVVIDPVTAVPEEVQCRQQLETFRAHLEGQFEAEPEATNEAIPPATGATTWLGNFYSVFLGTCFWSCCLRPIAHINEGVYQADNPHLFVV
jgi:hypothetical protein